MNPKTVINDDWNLLGVSQHIRELRVKIDDVARKPLTVLIQGPTGTGKELVARDIHEHSLRKNKPFKPINCGAIPENLIESELFGHEKGAFTGANQNKKGQVEVANGGTLFLDEIGELRLDHQVKLLRFLDNKTYCPVGSLKEIKVDVRVIAATNKDLAAEVKHKNFREDLYYRLAQSILKTAPLKDRPEDIVYLINSFSKDEKLEVDTKKKVLLYSYSFPGNVRELKNYLFKNHDQICEEWKEEWGHLGIHPNEFSRFQSYKGFNYLKRQAMSPEYTRYTWDGEEAEAESRYPWMEKLLNDRDAHDCLEAIFFIRENIDNLTKIIEAYEIATLLLSGMSHSEIAKLLRIRRGKVSLEVFSEYYGLTWPEEKNPFLGYFLMKLQYFPLFNAQLNKMRK